MRSYDPGTSSSDSESSGEEDAALNNSISSNDSVFMRPFMSDGENVESEEQEAADDVDTGEQEALQENIGLKDQVEEGREGQSDWWGRIPEPRQHFSDAVHFGGDRPAGGFGSSTPNPHWDRTGPVSRKKQQPVARQESEANQSETCNLVRQRSTKMGKFNAPPQFEADIPQSEKYERWLNWKASFDIALAICDGVPTGLQKVGLLYINVGKEVQAVIRMLELPPLHGEKLLRRGLYEELSAGLHSYFRTMVDESTDFARYSARKQNEGETIHDYALALRDLGLRVGIGHDSVGFRHQLIGGLKDKVLAKQAKVEFLQIGELIQRAGRMEQAAEADKMIAQTSSGLLGQSVLAVSSKREVSMKYRAHKRNASADGGGSGWKFGKCGSCGRRKHERGESCPAVGRECRECHKLNHFAAVCGKKGKGNSAGGEAKEEEAKPKVE